MEMETAAPDTDVYESLTIGRVGRIGQPIWGILVSPPVGQRGQSSPKGRRLGERALVVQEGKRVCRHGSSSAADGLWLRAPCWLLVHMRMMPPDAAGNCRGGCPAEQTRGEPNDATRGQLKPTSKPGEVACAYPGRLVAVTPRPETLLCHLAAPVIASLADLAAAGAASRLAAVVFQTQLPAHRARRGDSG